TLYRHCCDFESARIYPGVPEYSNPTGQGICHYLTGAASWIVLTALTQMYGVRGDFGDLVLDPKLLGQQFDEGGRAGVATVFANREFHVTYINEGKKDYGDYRIDRVLLGGEEITCGAFGGGVIIERELVDELSGARVHTLEVHLV
ncbi:MAG: cellobiose phosphorylase, partial [Acetanaerobacterium sp.]